MAEAPGLWINNQVCLLDWRGQVSDFQDEYLPLEWVQPGPNVHRSLEVASHLSIPQYRDAPPLKVNQAYWPTGAIRWAYGYLMLPASSIPGLSQETAVPFKFASETYKIETQVYALRPVSINAWKDSTSAEKGDCYLVPFVDKRYWWQFKEVDLSDGTDKNTTWQDLIDKIATALGEAQIILPGDPAPTIDPAWLKPDWSLLKYWNNAAAALDAVAHSIGRRVVVKWDGRVVLEEYADAFDEYTTNWTDYKDDQLRAGNQGEGSRPRVRDVKVHFRKAWMHMPACGDGFYEKEVNKHISPNGVEDTAWLVKSTAWASYTDYDPQTPDNQTELDNLAGQIATALDEWSRTSYDLAFNGCTPWEPCGIDDYLVHNYGIEIRSQEIFDPMDPDEPVQLREEYRRTVTCRAVSFPHNFYAKTQLSRSDSEEVFEGDEITARMVEDLTPGQTGKQATIVTWDKEATTWIDGPTIKIDDYWPSPGSQYGGVCALIGETLQIQNRGIMPDAFEDPKPTAANACQTISSISYGLTRVVTVQGDISPGSTGSATIERHDGSAGPTVTVKNRSATDVLVAGKALAFYCNHDGVWHSSAGLSDQGGGGGGGARLHLLEAYDYIQPGGSGQAYIYEWQDTTPCGWIPTVTLKTLYDSNGQNCLVPGEKVWALLQNKQCDQATVERYEIIGSHGLRRRVKAAADCACGSEGLATIMGEGQETPGSCSDGEETNYQLTACNRWNGALRHIWTGDQAWAEYDLQKKIWYYAEVDEPEFAKAEVVNLGCDGGNVPRAAINVQNFQFTTKMGASCNWTPDGGSGPTQVANPLLFPMRVGDQVELRRNFFFSPNHPTSAWEIFQVKPHQHYEVSDAGWTGDCPTLQFARKKFWGYSCDDEVDNVLTTSANTIQVDNVRSVTFENNPTNCRLVVDNSKICVAPGGSVQPITYPLEATRIELVKNILEGSTELNQVKQEVGVLCPGGEATTKVLDFYDCPDPPPANVSGPV